MNETTDAKLLQRISQLEIALEPFAMEAAWLHWTVFGLGRDRPLREADVYRLNQACWIARMVLRDKETGL